MSKQKKTMPVSIRILDKDYRIACPSEERDSLIKASLYLSDKMNEIKTNGKLVGGERVAVMAALHVTHELLQLREGSAENVEISEQLQHLQDKVETALYEGRQLEL